MRDTTYLALDLEINSDGQGWMGDIIQVGVAIGSVDGMVYRGEVLVRPYTPDRDNSLRPFITQLTGITQQQLDERGIGLAEVACWLQDLIEEHKPFVNPVQWGMGDAQELLGAFRNASIPIVFPYFGRRVIDVKHFFVFLEMANGRALSGGLKTAMGKYKIPFEGKPHRADTDAYNTLRFFLHLVRRQAELETTLRRLRTITY